MSCHSPIERKWHSKSKPDPFSAVIQSILRAPILQANGGTHLRGIFFILPDPNVTGRCIWAWAGPRPGVWGTKDGGQQSVWEPKQNDRFFWGRLVFRDADRGAYVPHPPLWAYRPEAIHGISKLKNWNDHNKSTTQPEEEGSSFQIMLKILSSFFILKIQHAYVRSDRKKSPALQHSIEIPLFLRLLLRVEMLSRALISTPKFLPQTQTSDGRSWFTYTSTDCFLSRIGLKKISQQGNSFGCAVELSIRQGCDLDSVCLWLTSFWGPTSARITKENRVLPRWSCFGNGYESCLWPPGHWGIDKKHLLKSVKHPTSATCHTSMSCQPVRIWQQIEPC